jgi:glycosyltransferase involved in cell wall biosynthesis
MGRPAPVKARVVVVQDALMQYRVPFFEQLRARLADDQIELRLLYGRRRETGAEDERSLDWAEELRVVRHRVWRGRVATWQPVLRRAWGADLVIVEHAAKHLVNLPFLGGQMTRTGPRLAFWGHGANLQATSRKSRVERAKLWAARYAHWWFAYTPGSADRVAAIGFPVSRITVVNNTIEVAALAEQPERYPLTCVYVGALYPHKRIEFLLRAGAHLAELVPGFRLVVLGSGVDRPLVEAAAPGSSWLDYRGATFDEEKAGVLASSSLLLMPGLVGLAIVDAFAFACPMVTTDQPFHSPEVEYLRDGDNGVMLPESTTPEQYAESVAALLRDTELMDRLREGCARSAAELSMGTMVERFADGVREALAAPARGR